MTGWLIYKRNRAGFWILWFGITLSPMLNIIPFRSLMNDRYMYLALLGPLAFVAEIVSSQMSGARTRRTALAAATLATLACAVLTASRVEVWASPISFWKDWIAKLHYTAAEPIYIAKQYDAKVAFLKEMTAWDPTSAAVHNNLGALYYESGRVREAVAELEMAARLAPSNGATFLNIGRAYARLGDLDRSKVYLKRATSLMPYSFLAHLNLARVYLALRDVGGARDELQACRRIRPPSSGSDPFWKRERDYLKQLEAARQEGMQS